MSHVARIVVIADQDESFRVALAASLRARGMQVVDTTLALVVAAVVRHRASLVILGASHHEEDAAIGAAITLRAGDERLPIVLIVQSGSEALAVAALRAGIKEYLKKPCGAADVAAVVANRLEASRRDASATPRAPRADAPHMIGQSAAAIEIRFYLARVAASNTNVLITGETGTGKELAAASIHNLSPRAHKRMVSINCAAIPEGLLESELFGYERGAFTGAAASRAGQLQIASGGTVLFDEIGDMGPLAQAKILRAIECREVYPLGGSRPIPVDVRIVAATNQDLERRVEEGAFRKDLYYRLNVARIRLPALRDRREDIPLLLSHYISEMNGRFKRDVEGLTDDALDHLVHYDWPGNVRELRNLVESIFVTLHGRCIGVDDLPAAVRACATLATVPVAGERERLVSALFASNWNKSLAAEKLHWSRMTVYRKIAKYRLVRSQQTEVDRADEPAIAPRDKLVVRN
jgi:DNA-binding NtrC family response regulator